MKIFNFLKHYKNSFVWRTRHLLRLDHDVHVVSPFVNDDGTVLLKIYAPKAESVKVEADWMPPNGWYLGNKKMTKTKSGIWEYLTPVLPPDLYKYSFLVDGINLTDPSNTFIVRDATANKSAFTIGDSTNILKTQNVPHGDVVSSWYQCEVSGISKRLNIYLPPQYEEGQQQFPALYLLHGAGGDEETWREQGRLVEIMDNLISAKQISPMIVVLPNSSFEVNAAPGFFNGWPSELPEHGKMMNKNFEKKFDEFVAYIDSKFRTVAVKEGRAIAGLSMGATQAFEIANSYPELFDYTGLFSFGVSSLKDDSFLQQEKKLEILFNNNPKLYWMAAGKDDGMYKEYLSYKNYLDAKGFNYVAYETESGHSWSEWRKYLIRFLPLLFR